MSKKDKKIIRYTNREFNTIKEGLVELKNGGAILTDSGNDERRRLLTLAGMNIAYKSEREEKDLGGQTA